MSLGSSSFRATSSAIMSAIESSAGNLGAAGTGGCGGLLLPWPFPCPLCDGKEAGTGGGTGNCVPSPPLGCSLGCFCLGDFGRRRRGEAASLVDHCQPPQASVAAGCAAKYVAPKSLQCCPHWGQKAAEPFTCMLQTGQRHAGALFTFWDCCIIAATLSGNVLLE